MPTPITSLRELFDACVDLPVAARASFLAAHCTDLVLRNEVESLLRADAEAAAMFAGGAQAAVEAIGEGDPAPVLPPGSRIGPFEILGVLGEGGTSTVFRARRESVGVRQDVALKILHRGLHTADAQRQFQRERQALAQLTHAGIARLIEGGVTEAGLAFIALELVEGQPITDFARERRLGLRDRLALFLQVCRAVSAAHQALIVHRDIKPSNVFVTVAGSRHSAADVGTVEEARASPTFGVLPAEAQIKLLDFGIAKLLEVDDETQTHQAMLTPAYAAPEQRSGGAVTTATDVFALGVLLGELVTGQRLNDGTGKTPSSRVAQDRGAGVLPAAPAETRRALRGDLDNIVLKAIAADPARRYVSAGALADDVERLLDGRPVAAHPPSRWYRASKFIGRHRAAVLGTSAFVIAILAALGLALSQAAAARRAAQTADVERMHAQHEAKRATATRDFLIRMFRASDPRMAQDKPRGHITAKELLDLNAPRIERDFADDADTRIELLGIAASIYRELDDTARYQELHRQQIDLARSRYGDLHPAIITGLLDDAAHASDRNDYAEASGLLDQADPLLHRAGLDRSALRARWLLLRSYVPTADARASKANDDALDRAVALYAEIAPNDSGYVEALTNMGYRNQRTGGGSAAEPWFRRAIAAAETSSDRDDAQLQQFTYPGLAAALEFQGKFDEAEQAYRHSVELARKTYGEAHSTYWVPAADFAALVHRQGDRKRAHALFDELFRVIPQPWDVDSYDDYAREFYAACLIAEGRPQDAIPLLEASLHTYLTKPSVEYELRRVRLTLGDAYDQVGRTEEARTMLKASLDERIEKDPPDGGTIRAARERWGRFLLAQGDVAGAEEQFRLVLDQEHGRRFATFALAHADMAQVLLRRSDNAGALDMSRAAVDSFDHVTGRRDVRVGPVLWLVHAEALRRTGDIEAARKFAERALEASRRYDDPSAESIRQAEAQLRAASARS